MPARFRRTAFAILTFSLIALTGCASRTSVAPLADDPGPVDQESGDPAGDDTSAQASAAQAGDTAVQEPASEAGDMTIQDAEAEAGETVIEDAEAEPGDVTIEDAEAEPGEPELLEPDDTLDDPRIPSPGMWSLEILDGELTCDGQTVALPGSSTSTVELTVFDGGKTIVVDSLEGQVVTLDQTEINDTATVYEGEFVNADGAAGVLTLGFIHSGALQTIEGSTEAELQGCHAWRRLEGYPAG